MRPGTKVVAALLIAAIPLLAWAHGWAPQGSGSGGGSGVTGLDASDGQLVWLAEDMVAPVSTTTFATFDVRNGHGVLDFDAATHEAIEAHGVMPESYAAGNLTVTIYWAATSATSGDAVLSVEWENEDPGTLDLDADSYATAQTVTTTTSGTSGVLNTSTIAFTQAQADSVAALDTFRLRVSRRADDAADTMAGDLELRAVIVGD